MKNLLIISVLLLVGSNGFGQKYMIKKGDTLPYKLESEISDGKTIYLGECFTFEKVNNKIINQTDDNCLKQGDWVLINDNGNYLMGTYKDNRKFGVWKEFDKQDNLLTETKKISIGDDVYLVKKITYQDGIATVMVDKKFLSFYLDNLFLILWILGISFFGRVFINSRIYNIENGTEYSPIRIIAPGYISKNTGHSMLCVFSFWFSNYKPENRVLVIISNTMSVIALGLFFGTLLGLAITGNLS